MYLPSNIRLMSRVFILSSVLWSPFSFCDEQDYRSMLQLQKEALITSPSTGAAIAVTHQVFMFVCQKQLTSSELKSVMQSSSFEHLVQQIERQRSPVGITTGKSILEDELDRYRCVSRG